MNKSSSHPSICPRVLTIGVAAVFFSACQASSAAPPQAAAPTAAMGPRTIDPELAAKAAALSLANQRQRNIASAERDAAAKAEAIAQQALPITGVPGTPAAATTP